MHDSGVAHTKQSFVFTTNTTFFDLEKIPFRSRAWSVNRSQVSGPYRALKVWVPQNLPVWRQIMLTDQMEVSKAWQLWLMLYSTRVRQSKPNIELRVRASARVNTAKHVLLFYLDIQHIYDKHRTTITMHDPKHSASIVRMLKWLPSKFLFAGNRRMKLFPFKNELTYDPDTLILHPNFLPNTSHTSHPYWSTIWFVWQISRDYTSVRPLLHNGRHISCKC